MVFGHGLSASAELMYAQQLPVVGGAVRLALWGVMGIDVPQRVKLGQGITLNHGAYGLVVYHGTEIRDRVGVATMVVGGAGVVTGLVLVVMNRARVEVEADPRAGAARVEVTPLLGAGAIGLSVAGRH